MNQGAVISAPILISFLIVNHWNLIKINALLFAPVMKTPLPSTLVPFKIDLIQFHIIFKFRHALRIHFFLRKNPFCRTHRVIKIFLRDDAAFRKMMLPPPQKLNLLAKIKIHRLLITFPMCVRAL